MKLTDKIVIEALKNGKRLRSDILDDGWFLCLAGNSSIIFVINEYTGVKYPMKLDLEVITATDWGVISGL